MFHGRIEPALPITGAPARARRSWLVLAAAVIAILPSAGTPARAQGARKAPAEARGSASTRKKPEKPALPVDEGKEKDPVHDEFLKVNYLFNRELYDLAIPRYEAILQANPGYARAEAIHHALALSHYNLAAKATPRPGAPGKAETAPGAEGDPRTAHLRKSVHHLKEALKKKDFEPRLESTRLLGQCLLLLQDGANAAKTFQWVLERSPRGKESAAAAIGLGEALAMQSRHSEAATAFRKALELGPEDDERERAEYHLALALARSGDAAAEAEGTKVLDRLAAASGPYADDARYMKASVRQSRGDDAGAIEDFAKLVEAGSPEFEEAARFGLGTALLRAGRHAEAADALKKLLDRFPQGARKDLASVYLARALIESGKAGAGLKMLQDLRASPSAGGEASLWLARMLVRHGKPRNAVPVLEAALGAGARGTSKDALELELASALLADGQFDAAGEALSRFEAAHRESGSAHADQVAYLKAYALHRAGKHAASLEACARFANDHPESPLRKEAAALAAENHFLANDHEKALSAYGAYLEEFDTALDGLTKLKGRFRMAQAMYLAGRPGEAMKAIEAIDPAALGEEAERAFREDPLFATHRYVLGDAAYRLKDHARAQGELAAFLEDPRLEPAGLTAEANDARFKLAHALQLSGNIAGARAAFVKALRTDPKSPHAEQILFELGQIAYAEKDMDAAAQAFAKVASRGRDSRFAPHALRFLGWIAYEKKDYAGAAESYEKLATTYPEHELAPDAEYHLALSLQGAGRREEAARALERFRAKRPDDPRLARILLQEAIQLVKDGKHDEALASLEKLRKEKGGEEILPSILYETAWCHRGRKDLDLARAAYGELIALEHAGELGATARLELAELEFEEKNYAKALETLEPLAKAPRLPTDPALREKVLYRIVWTRHMLGDAAGTLAAEDAFLKEFPSSPLALELSVLAAKAHLAKGDPAKAGAIFLSITEAKPGSPEAEAAELGHAECLAEERKFAESRKRFEAFLGRHPGSPSAYRARFGIAWAAENTGRHDEAMKLYREVARETATPTGARAQFQLGQCLVAKKNHKDAIAEFLQVAAGYRYPEWTSRALLQAAGCFEALGDAENARKYYEEVVTGYPGRDEARLARERISKLEASSP
jgi:TolA-binding protein